LDLSSEPADMAEFPVPPVLEPDVFCEPPSPAGVDGLECGSLSEPVDPDE
jgi:hypothetical protein